MLKVAKCLEDDYSFHKLNGGQNDNQPKSGNSNTLQVGSGNGFKGDKKRKWDNAPHKVKDSQDKKIKRGIWAKLNASIANSWDTSLKLIMVRWDWKEGKFLGNASVATLGPNLILLNYKVGINVVSCLLDFKTMHLFVKPNVVKQLGWVVRKVVKPIWVQLAKGDVKSAHMVALGVNLKCA